MLYFKIYIKESRRFYYIFYILFYLFLYVLFIIFILLLYINLNVMYMGVFPACTAMSQVHAVLIEAITP